MFGVVIALIIVLIVLNEIIKRRALRNLIYRREISQHRVEVGEEFSITTILENRGLFPIPFLHVLERVPSQLYYKSAVTEFETLDEKNHELSVHLLPKQRVKRKYPVSFGKRGRYFFRDVTLSGGDFLGFSTVDEERVSLSDIIVYPKTLDLDVDLVPYGSFYGDISVQRWIINDPILSVGIREYTGNEPQKNIHWASSLRSGRLMVKNFDFTTDNQVMLILNIETDRPFCTNIKSEVIEKCLSATRGLMERFESLGIPYGFATNIHSKEELGGKGYIPSGQGNAHFYRILELLGRADYHIWMSLEDILSNFMHGMDHFVTYVIITPVVLEQYINHINLLSKNVSKMMLISMEEEHLSDLNENIRVLLGRS